MKAIAKETALAVCGGCLYVVLELLWRGRSHWTMFILGGVCFVLIGAINEVIPWEMPLVLQGVIGSACIVTPLEFVTGCIVNLWLNGQQLAQSFGAFGTGGQAACLGAVSISNAEGINRFYGTYHEVSILPAALRDEQLRALTIV